MKQDRQGVRTAQDLERKYDLASILGLKKAAETNSKILTRVNNELYAMLSTLSINLSGYTDQGEISLWFYPGVPTTSNQPYTDWTTPSDHYGDIYYDQTGGVCYQYTSDGWKGLDDISLVKAMALTNADIDASDHERKIFFNTPSPPYSNGDWWIKDTGQLFICQVSKASGTYYEEKDFITFELYTQTIAEKEGDTTTVVCGCVLTIKEAAYSWSVQINQKVGLNNVISSINLTSESATIKASKINLNGIVTAMNNGTTTKINGSAIETGSITADHINVTDLNAFGATIGGWDINPTSLTNVYNGLGIGFCNGASDTNLIAVGIPVGASDDITTMSWGDAPFRVTRDGSVYATKGLIGGWVIESNVLGNKLISEVADGNRVGMAPGINTTDYSINSVDGLCFWAGALWDANSTDLHKVAISQAPFRVYADGTLHCSNAYIKGQVEATSGKIGGFSLNTYSLDCTKDGKRAIINSNSIGISGNVVFGVYDGSSWTAYIDGGGKLVSTNAVITGNITATSGTIGGCSITDGVLKVPVANISGTITANAISVTNFSASSSGVSMAGWTVDNNSIRAGTLGSSGSMWLVRNGSNSSASIGNRSGSGWCIAISSNFGVTSGGALYCSSGNIGTGMTIGSLSDVTNKIELTSTKVYCWTSGSTRYQGRWHDIVRSGIYWNDNLSSDRRIKNSIETLDSRYETLFDNLIPVRFKFNEGTSGRYHTGFIAQEVKDAMDVANITTQEFACFCIDDEGTEYEKMMLRKDEIIALCVSEIQKLKARVSALEVK